jgi:hypothetical protein
MSSLAVRHPAASLDATARAHVEAKAKKPELV